MKQPVYRVAKIAAPVVAVSTAAIAALFLSSACGPGYGPGSCDIPPPGQEVYQYAATCYEATHIHVPAFNCDDGGTPVPTENPMGSYGKMHCDRPNVLNDECDPGSRFHVLEKTPEAFVVAHCRKKDPNRGDGLYGDIAIIQHNQVNGATCFYQAYPNKGGAGDDLEAAVGSPEDTAGSYPWMSPAEINNAGFRCVQCHDNGPLIRSPYLAQLADLPGADPMHQLPGTSDNDPDWPKTGFNSPSKLYNFAGADFQTWKVESITVDGTICTNCHRMGLGSAFGEYIAGTGTSQSFGVIATDESLQTEKNPYDPNQPDVAPFWWHYMMPSVNGYDADAHQDALLYQQCAIDVAQGQPPPAGCHVTLYGQGNTCVGN